MYLFLMLPKTNLPAGHSQPYRLVHTLKDTNIFVEYLLEVIYRALLQILLCVYMNKKKMKENGKHLL